MAEGGAQNSRRSRRRRRKTCTNQLLLMFARTTCRIRNASRQASRESELATFTCCAYDTPWSDFCKSFFLLMLLTWLLIKHSHTHTQRNTRRTTDTHSCRVKASKSFSYWIRQFKWIRRQCHRHDHRHYHRHRQRQWQRHRQSNNCCGFAPAQTAQTLSLLSRICHYSVAGLNVGLWLTNSPQRIDFVPTCLGFRVPEPNPDIYNAHTGSSYICPTLHLCLSLSLLSFVTTNYLCDLISFPFCCCCSARHQAARFVSLYFRVWFACGWWKMFAADWLAAGSCRMRINQIKASPLSARENPEKPF